mmetsp:Transcript_14485/g.29922  ORF Transcript_14485/g.29922 Transcript_14485/m.29922 type:complete len:550 (-) Transcript_14485:115-1764(-)
MKKFCWILFALIRCPLASGFTNRNPTHLKLGWTQPDAIPASSSTLQVKFIGDDEEERTVIEETRMKVLRDRRKMIRGTLRSAEYLKNFRLSNGFVPEIDPETGKPSKSDGKMAVSLTAVVVAIGAVTLRVGGRAALISAVGLDFMTDNPELKENLDQVLAIADQTDPITKVALFTAAWTVVKVSCFDAAGIALALSSGILFGGVIQGAVACAAAATFGSCVSFTLAKLDTPVRRKALEIVEEYPSLRGIEKVVAEDGIKAILTLRLAPILPIPIGMYNYVYGVTNVPVLDFCGGIFLGSLKPYLLDSYLGYFGKELVDGSAASATGLQDVILLVALGISVLIGVFASQLASETYDSILEEVELEKQAKLATEGGDDDTNDDGISREFLGFQLPDWVVGFQYVMKDAEVSIQNLIDTELKAQVWNYTETNNEGQLIVPDSLDPALNADSPERSEANQGIDFGFSFCESLCLSPQLFTLFFKAADPIYSFEEDEELQKRNARRNERNERREENVSDDLETKRQALLERAQRVRSMATQRIKLLDDRIQNDE